MKLSELNIVSLNDLDADDVILVNDVSTSGTTTKGVRIGDLTTRAMNIGNIVAQDLDNSSILTIGGTDSNTINLSKIAFWDNDGYNYYIKDREGQSIPLNNGIQEVEFGSDSFIEVTTNASGSSHSYQLPTKETVENNYINAATLQNYLSNSIPSIITNSDYLEIDSTEVPTMSYLSSTYITSDSLLDSLSGYITQSDLDCSGYVTSYNLNDFFNENFVNYASSYGYISSGDLNLNENLQDYLNEQNYARFDNHGLLTDGINSFNTTNLVFYDSNSNCLLDSRGQTIMDLSE